MELTVSLETICRLILRAKELEAQVPAVDPDDDPDDVDDYDDEGGEALSVLQDELNDGVEEEVQALLDDLAEDQLAEIVALAWVGRGTYDNSEWNDAFEEANSLDPLPCKVRVPYSRVTLLPEGPKLCGRVFIYFVVILILRQIFQIVHRSAQRGRCSCRRNQTPLGIELHAKGQAQPGQDFFQGVLHRGSS